MRDLSQCLWGGFGSHVHTSDQDHWKLLSGDGRPEASEKVWLSVEVLWHISGDSCAFALIDIICSPD